MVLANGRHKHEGMHFLPNSSSIVHDDERIMSDENLFCI